MRKVLTLTLVLVGIATSMAYEYPFLTFQSTDGTTKSMSVESLDITVSNGQLAVTNADGTQTFTLTDLSKMYFSENGGSTDIANVDTGNDHVDVFTISGMHLGTFQTIDAAKASLKPGLYVMKSKNKTLKITVK